MSEIKPVALSTIFFRLFAGLGSGLAGTVVIGIVLLLSWSAVGNTLLPPVIETADLTLPMSANDPHPLFLHFVMLAVFLGGTVSSIVHALLMPVLDEHYTRRSTSLTHVFFGSLFTLLFFLPAYLLVNKSFGPSGVGSLALAHIVLNAVCSNLIIEILRRSKHELVQLYGVLIGVTFFGFFAVLLAHSSSALALLALPLLFGFLSMGTGIAQAMYAWMYQLYGVDFLNTETNFGADYGTDPVDPE